VGAGAGHVDERVDVAVVGAGGAGLSLLHQLAVRGPRGLRVALVDPVDRLATRPADRTWCFWDEGASDLDAAVHRAWDRVVVVGPDHRRRVLHLAPMRYVLLRGQDFYSLAADATASLDVVRLTAPVTGVADGEDGATVTTAAGCVRARWVFDSRPAPPRRPAATTLLQHFHGVQVRAEADVFDPDLPVLMDFTTPQPRQGLSFGYCLPSDARRALVEYTEFSPAVLDAAGYARALEAYLPHMLGGDVPHEVERTERGVIPMTDAVFARRAGRRVFRLGTAGGATRPSTGYTFAAMQRQAAAVAAALAAGRDPLPPRPYPRRHGWMDALVLRALADGSLDGPAFFARLFDRNPPQRVLRFLDGLSTPASELAVMATAPRGVMLRAAARDAAWRLTARRRPAASA
jgi:lycopene beta-cyclase